MHSSTGSPAGSGPLSPRPGPRSGCGSAPLDGRSSDGLFAARALAGRPRRGGESVGHAPRSHREPRPRRAILDRRLQDGVRGARARVRRGAGRVLRAAPQGDVGRGARQGQARPEARAGLALRREVQGPRAPRQGRRRRRARAALARRERRRRRREHPEGRSSTSSSRDTSPRRGWPSRADAPPRLRHGRTRARARGPRPDREGLPAPEREGGGPLRLRCAPPREERRHRRGEDEVPARPEGVRRHALGRACRVLAVRSRAPPDRHDGASTSTRSTRTASRGRARSCAAGSSSSTSGDSGEAPAAR